MLVHAATPKYRIPPLFIPVRVIDALVEVVFEFCVGLLRFEELLNSGTYEPACVAEFHVSVSVYLWLEPQTTLLTVTPVGMLNVPAPAAPFPLADLLVQAADATWLVDIASTNTIPVKRTHQRLNRRPLSSTLLTD